MSLISFPSRSLQVRQTNCDSTGWCFMSESKYFLGVLQCPVFITSTHSCPWSTRFTAQSKVPNHKLSNTRPLCVVSSVHLAPLMSFTRYPWWVLQAYECRKLQPPVAQVVYVASRSFLLRSPTRVQYQFSGAQQTWIWSPMVLAFEEYKIYWGAQHPFFTCWVPSQCTVLALQLLTSELQFCPALIKEDDPSLLITLFNNHLGAKILCLCLHFGQNTRSNFPNHDVVVHADAVLVFYFLWVSTWTKANALDPKFALVPFIWVLESNTGVFHGDRLAGWCTLWCKRMVSNMLCLVGRIFFAKFWDPDLETHTSPTLHTSQGNS